MNIKDTNLLFVLGALYLDIYKQRYSPETYGEYFFNGIKGLLKIAFVYFFVYLMPLIYIFGIWVAGTYFPPPNTIGALIFSFSSVIGIIDVVCRVVVICIPKNSSDNYYFRYFRSEVRSLVFKNNGFIKTIFSRKVNIERS